MDFDMVEQDSLLIVPKHLQDKILEEKNKYPKLLSFSMLSFKELREKVFFSYKNDTKFYLVCKYNYHPGAIDPILESLYFLDENKSYEEKKLKDLKDLFEELDKNGYIKRDPFFLLKYKKKKVYVYGYDSLTSFEERMLSFFDNVLIIEKKEIENRKLKIYECSTLEEEVKFVTEKILELLYSGVPLEKIRLFGGGDIYTNEFLRMKKFYSLPFSLTEVSLFSTAISQRYLTLLEEEQDFLSAYCKLVELYPNSSSFFLKVKNKLKSLVQKYSIYDKEYFNEAYSLFFEELKKVTFKKEELAFSLSFEEMKDQVFLDDEYVFFVGINQTVFPKLYKDEDYLSDSLKKVLGLEDANMKNKRSFQDFVKMIKRIPNLCITYKLRHLKEEFHPSHALLELEVEKEKAVISNIQYSTLASSLKLSSLLDDFIKYGKKDKDLALYYHNISLPYMSYDNHYQKIDQNMLFSYLKNKLTLSYSSIDTFYHCSFRYYLQHILKINSFTSSFQTEIGTLFHFVLSKMNTSSFDFDLVYDSYLQDKDFSKKEMFFLRKIKKDLRLLIEYIKKFQDVTYLTDMYYEKEFHIDKSSLISVDLMGIIDKIMYREKDGNTYVSVVDYKTGSKSIKLNRSIHGLDLQLILYLYFIKESKLFDNPCFVGFYLQKILSKEKESDPTKDYETRKMEEFKFQGYSTTNTEWLEKFDMTYEQSEFIKSMRTTQKGFATYAKVVSEEEVEKLIELAEQLVIKARDEILNAQFSIDPKRIEREDVGCEFCRFRDICFKTEKDFVELKEYKDLSFLRGDDNA